MKKLLLFAAIAVLVVVTAGCSTLDLGSGADKLTGGGTGQLAVYLADKPVNNVEKVLVTIKEVQINRDDEWTTINSFDVDQGEGEFDLLKLRFEEDLLGQTSLPSGTYSQIRLIVAADKDGQAGMGNYSGMSKVVFSDDTPDEDIFIPSGTQTGIKISGEFTIEPDMITELILDVDLSELIHQAGNDKNGKRTKIILHPNKIKPIVKNISGNIEGQVLADQQGDGNHQALTETDVVVDALVAGEVIGTTVATSSDQTNEAGEVIKPAGSFKIRGLPEGTYTLQAYPVDGNGNKDTSIYSPAEVPDISVSADNTTTLEDPLILEKQ